MSDTEVGFDLDRVARFTHVLANLADKTGTDFLSLHQSLVAGRQFSLVLKSLKSNLRTTSTGGGGSTRTHKTQLNFSLIYL